MLWTVRGNGWSTWAEKGGGEAWEEWWKRELGIVAVGRVAVVIAARGPMGPLYPLTSASPCLCRSLTDVWKQQRAVRSGHGKPR